MSAQVNTKCWLWHIVFWMCWAACWGPYRVATSEHKYTCAAGCALSISIAGKPCCRLCHTISIPSTHQQVIASLWWKGLFSQSHPRQSTAVSLRCKLTTCVELLLFLYPWSHPWQCFHSRLCRRRDTACVSSTSALVHPTVSRSSQAFDKVRPATSAATCHKILLSFISRRMLCRSASVETEFWCYQNKGWTWRGTVVTLWSAFARASDRQTDRHCSYQGNTLT